MTVVRASMLGLAMLLGACGRKADREPCPPPAAAAGGVISLAPPANPVQAEMRLLAASMETAVRGVGLGDVSEVQHALHRVHEAKQATEAAIHGGTWKPALNADRLETLVAMDEAFHGHLERLVAASAKGDVPATAAALGDALRGCDGCHAMFRAPSAAAPSAAPAQVHEHAHEH